MPIIGTVRNWRKFQHYTTRRPPWIKLHRELLDDFDFIGLPLASKALAPLLWLLAAESDDGSFRLDPEWLSFRLRMSKKDVEAGLTPLIEKGFIGHASELLAIGLQDACLEGEGEAEREGEKIPRKRGKPTKTSLPDGFGISERVKKWAAEKGHGRLTEHLEAFLAKAAAHGYTYVDWDAAFMEAVRNNWAKLEAAPTIRANAKPPAQALAPTETKEQQAAAWKKQMENLGVNV